LEVRLTLLKNALRRTGYAVTRVRSARNKRKELLFLLGDALKKTGYTVSRVRSDAVFEEIITCGTTRDGSNILPACAYRLLEKTCSRSARESAISRTTTLIEGAVSPSPKVGPRISNA
jgi:hypothetical protein